MDFKNANELLDLCKKHDLPISEVMRQREIVEGEKEADTVHDAMARVLEIMKNAAFTPIKEPVRSMGGLIGGEAKKLSLHQTSGKSDEQIIQALFNASAIGYLAMRNATVAGAVGGCQAEVGVASAMAASAIVELLGGDPEQCLGAASTVLMNMLGLVCDPVGGLVEYPCQNRNAAGVANAIIAAEISLSGIHQLIPFDEMLNAMYIVGKRLPAELRETAQGGCAATPSACAACGGCA